MSRTLLAVLTFLAVGTSGAFAQHVQTSFRAGRPLLASRAPDGDLWSVATVETDRGEPADGCELSRMGPSGVRAITRVIEGASEVTELHADAAGAYVVVVTRVGDARVAELRRFDQNGQPRWSVRLEGPHYSELHLHHDSRGLYLSGMYDGAAGRLRASNGSVGPRWPASRFRGFLAQIDPETGDVLRARRTRHFGGVALSADGLAQVSERVPRTRRGDPPPRTSELRMSRFDRELRSRGQTRHEVPGAVDVRGVGFFPSGELAVVTETCAHQDPEGRCITEGHLYAFAEADLVTDLPVPAWATLTRPAGGPLRVVGPEGLRRVRREGRVELEAASLAVLTFDSPRSPVRGRVSFPESVIVNVTPERPGQSHIDGVTLLVGLRRGGELLDMGVVVPADSFLPVAEISELENRTRLPRRTGTPRSPSLVPTILSPSRVSPAPEAAASPNPGSNSRSGVPVF